jgi:hypothetical protein
VRLWTPAEATAAPHKCNGRELVRSGRPGASTVVSNTYGKAGFREAELLFNNARTLFFWSPATNIPERNAVAAVLDATATTET